MGCLCRHLGGREASTTRRWMTSHPWVGVVLGVVVSGLVHTGKTAARPAINAGTLGFGAPVASTVEDGAAVGLSLVALFLPGARRRPPRRPGRPCSSGSGGRRGVDVVGATAAPPWCEARVGRAVPGVRGQTGHMTVAAVPRSRRSLVTETVLVLGVSLGASAIWSLLAIVNKLTQQRRAQPADDGDELLGHPRPAVARPGLPARRHRPRARAGRPGPPPAAPRPPGRHARDRRRPAPARPGPRARPAPRRRRGAARARRCMPPRKAFGLNTTIAAANLTDHWWTVPGAGPRGRPERGARRGHHGRLPLHAAGARPAGRLPRSSSPRP